ncbi:MAG TPA: carboxypeptidase regulatory-like domain-containing protein [Bryobacteraceae bacterium]
MEIPVKTAMAWRGRVSRIAWMWFVFSFGAWTSLIVSPKAVAQSIISGDVTGTVTDPAGATVPDAKVTLTNVATNISQTTSTNMQGNYRFSFLTPGTYKVTVNATGFQATQTTGLLVTAGQPTPADVQLKVATAAETIEVSTAAEAVETENADVTTNFTSQMLDNLPTPGGDITYYAQTAPGVVMNTQMGYGNFVAQGMPAVSNLFTINGVNYDDPFFSINNSGASNLLLGSNDIAEANVINNAYSAQYGQYAGSQIAYITKSGSNSFHGDVIYNWNGRYLNSNSFFGNQAGLPTPFNNFNQWQTGVNGPIWKNHTFFDVDYEGTHDLLPTAPTLQLIPSPQFQAATLSNLTAVGNAAEIPFYKQLFAIYNNAPGAGSATPQSDSCGGGSFTGLPASAPCALGFRSTSPSILTEYQWSARVDHTFSDKDRGNIRVLRDNGFQPTFTSPFGPQFNSDSNQPELTGQIAETHIFGPNTVNEFKGSALYYSAIFEPSQPNAELAALPTWMDFSDGSFASAGAYGGPQNYFYPNGRRIFQYQILDDFVHVRGKHTFRVGFSWLHWTVTDLDFASIDGPTHGQIITTLSDFFNGGGPSSILQQTFPSSLEEGIRMNTFGGYVADDWKVNNRLTLSLNLRLEHYPNPTCDNNCFAYLKNTFTTTPNPNAANIPYDQLVTFNQHYAYANTQIIKWEPRIGIAWKPTHSDKTVIRTGAGVFADVIPGGLAESSAFNTPTTNPFVLPASVLAPGVPGSPFTLAAQANKALVSGFASGATFNSLSAAVPGFSPPNFTTFPNTFDNPTYYKWNFEVQQVIPGNMVFSANYAGMHGSHIPIDNAGINAYCPPDTCPTGFGPLPAAPPNPALGVVNQYLSAANSNYNGLILSLQKRLSAGLSFTLNYTWSHALDDISNGGISNLPFSALATNYSLTTPQNPYNLKANYGNSEYDVRHYLSANLVFTDVFRRAGLKWGPNRLVGGWTLSGNWFWRSGLPFTVVDGLDYAGLAAYNYPDATVFASPVTKLPKTCLNAVNAPCLTPSMFAPAGALTGFGTMGRNSIYGPHFFNIDAALMKDVRITEHVNFTFGVQAYNILNHPNFDTPVDNLAAPNFASSILEVGSPTSILGSFFSPGAAAPRFLEIKGTVRFLTAPQCTTSREVHLLPDCFGS